MSAYFNTEQPIFLVEERSRAMTWGYGGIGTGPWNFDVLAPYNALVHMPVLLYQPPNPRDTNLWNDLLNERRALKVKG